MVLLLLSVKTCLESLTTLLNRDNELNKLGTRIILHVDDGIFTLYFWLDLHKLDTTLLVIKTVFRTTSLITTVRRIKDKGLAEHRVLGLRRSLKRIRNVTSLLSSLSWCLFIENSNLLI